MPNTEWLNIGPYQVDTVTAIEVDAIVSMVTKDVRYDVRVSRVIRTVTEALSSHDREYRFSTVAKRTNRTVSMGALELYQHVDRIDQYTRHTILEHRVPIKWLYIILQHKNRTDPPMTSEKVIQVLIEFPLVTVTLAEDRRLRDLPITTLEEALDRYTRADIEITELPHREWG